MKKIAITIFALCIFMSACKKENTLVSTSTSLNVVNGTLDVTNLAVNFSPSTFTYSSNLTFISDLSALEFGLQSGSNVLNLVSSNDTTRNLYHGTLSLKTGGIYSIFVAGSAGQYSTVFMQDNIPVFGNDSIAGLRVINLSPDSQPLNVGIQGNSSNDFSSIAYKSITAFKKYPANSTVVNNGGYNLDVTNAAGIVLATFNWIPQIFNKSNTLVITGSVANGNVSVFSVNNY